MNIPIEMTNRVDEWNAYELVKDLCLELGREEMDIYGEEILDLAKTGHFEALRALHFIVGSPWTAEPYFLKFDLGIARDAIEAGKKIRRISETS